MRELFEVASGSMVGHLHVGGRGVLVGKCNQDAHNCQLYDDCIIAVVCDGCSEVGDGTDPFLDTFTQFGSHWASRVLPHLLHQYIQRYSLPELRDKAPSIPWLERMRQDLLARMRLLANEMGESFSRVVLSNFLFTVVVLIVTPQSTWVISIGDGIYCLNSQVFPIGPFHENKPPYLAYGLFPPTSYQFPELITFQVNAALPTSELQSALIGSDGVKDMQAQAMTTIPGQKVLVGPLSQFWLDPFYYENPDGVRRKLALINREVVRPNWQEGKLNWQSGLVGDDVTLVALRRKPLS